MRKALFYILLCLTVSEIAAQEWYSKSLEVKALSIDTSYSPKHLQKELVYFDRLLEREPYLRDALYYKTLIFYRIYQADTTNSKRLDNLMQAGRYMGSCMSGREDNEEYLALYLLIRTALLKEEIGVLMWPGEKSPDEYSSIDSVNPRLLLAQAYYLDFRRVDPDLIEEKLISAGKSLEEESGLQYPSWGLIEIEQLKSVKD